MMNHTLKSPFRVKPGTVLAGKWHENKYEIIKELGLGANGVVYLAKTKGTHVALKMSENSMSITSEVNVLKSFAKVQGSALGPSLLDVDDWRQKDGQISFYVMEYIHGPNLLTFIEQKGKSWAPVLCLQLLSNLEELHRAGWVFGDLKPENLIVTGPPPKIRCIDVGGTTLIGRAIKEFTEFYDRGYWGLGSRKAEPTYDLFAVAMIMINTAYPKRFEKTLGGISQLKEAIGQKPQLKKYELVLLNALHGRYPSARQMRTDLLNCFSENRNPYPAAKPREPVKQKEHRKQETSISRMSYRKKQKKASWVETMVIAGIMSFILMVLMLYIFTK